MTERDPKLIQAERLLERLRIRQLKITLQGSLYSWLGLLSAIWLTLGFFESAFRLPQTIRFILPVLGILLSTVTAIIQYRRIVGCESLKPGDKARYFWALRLGELSSTRESDRLLNALQVAMPKAGHRDAPSPELARESLYRAVADLDVIDSDRAIYLDGRKKEAKFGGALILTSLLALIFTPSSLLPAYQRILHPFVSYDQTADFSIAIEPAGGWAYRDEPVRFEVNAKGSHPASGSFFYRLDGGDEIGLEIDIRTGRATVDFDGFPADITYRAVSGKVSTDRYKFQIIPRPQIVELGWQLNPPAYSRLPVVSGRENVGDIECLPGSAVELSITASKKLASALLLMTRISGDSSAVDTVSMDVSGNQARVEFVVRKPLTYSIRISDRDGHHDKDPVTYRIQTLADEYPAVRIAYPEEDILLGDDMLVPLRIEADDDFGVARLELNYRNLNNDTDIQSWLLSSGKSTPGLSIDTLWELGGMPLMPGDVLEYWAVVWDNDNVSGPKRGESSRRMVRLPTFEEIIAGIEQSEAEVEFNAEKTLEAAKELKEEVARLVEEMRRDPNADWERRNQIEQALNNQEQLSKQADQLSRSLDELVNKLEKHDALTTETLEKYMELQKLMDEVASPELRDAMEKLKQAMDSEDPEKIRQALEKFDMDREEFLRSVERSLAILQQLKMERKLDELTKRAEELLHAQEQVLKDIEGDRSESAMQSLERQKAGVEALQQELAETGKMATENGESALAEDLDSLGSRMKSMSISAQMQQTQQSLRSGNRQKATSSGEESARQLAEMASALGKMAADYKEQNKAELAQKIRRLIEELIYVSESQEELLDESKILGTQSPRYRELAGAQQDVKQALAGIAGRMLDLSKETFFVTPELGASLGKAMQNIDRSLAGFSERLPRSAVQPQKQALGEINRSAAQLLAILGELSGSSSSSGYEEMMEKLSQMASQQQGLNQESMSMPMPGGGSPGQIPGEGESLAGMAARQRALQRQMEQAAEEAQGIEEMLGDLQGVADAMGDVAKDMENQQIVDRTRRLQQQIVSRLLDATRAAREEEYSKKRESKTGEEAPRLSPPPVQLDAEREKLRRDLMRALQEGYTPDYRRLIRDYYDALDREIIKK